MVTAQGRSGLARCPWRNGLAGSCDWPPVVEPSDGDFEPVVGDLHVGWKALGEGGVHEVVGDVSEERALRL